MDDATKNRVASRRVHPRSHVLHCLELRGLHRVLTPQIVDPSFERLIFALDLADDVGYQNWRGTDKAGRMDQSLHSTQPSPHPAPPNPKRCHKHTHARARKHRGLRHSSEASLGQIPAANRLIQSGLEGAHVDAGRLVRSRRGGTLGRWRGGRDRRKRSGTPRLKGCGKAGVDRIPIRNQTRCVPAGLK